MSRKTRYPRSSKYPPKLEDEFAISAYMTEQSPHEVDEDLIEEFFCGCSAVLTELPLASLIEGGLENNLPSPAKERRYARMNPDTMPPLVVSDDVVMDGNHRLRVLRARGAKSAWCYNITDDYYDKSGMPLKEGAIPNGNSHSQQQT